MIPLSIAIYLIGAVLAYGHTYHFFQTEHGEMIADESRKSHRIIALMMATYSWIGFALSVLLASYLGDDPNRHGFKFK